MIAPACPGPFPQPGQFVRWRYPRQAFALGWFNTIGPGPFPVVGFIDGSDRNLPPALLLQTAAGNRPVNALWVGLPE